MENKKKKPTASPAGFEGDKPITCSSERGSSMYDYTRKNKQNKVFYNQNGKVIGTLVDKTLRKKVRGSIHKLRVPPGWACDKTTIEEAEKLGGVSIEITDSETGKKFLAKFIDFRKYGILINRGYCEQIALPMVYWFAEDERNPQLKLF